MAETRLPGSSPPPTSEQQSGGGCLLRVLWMPVGHVAILVAAMAILRSREWFLSWADGFFWAAVAGTLAVRYVDIARFGGMTAAGKPATKATWRRYALILLGGAAALWAAAHAGARLGW